MIEDDDAEPVRYNVQMPETLREDAKANAERGELAEEVRAVFRRKAYGLGEAERPTELEQTKTELREVRDQIDRLRSKRGRVDVKIQSKEARANRLEERLSEIEERRSELDAKLSVLENMLLDGQPMWPIRIKTAVDVDIDTARELHRELRDRNPELPSAAFEEPHIHAPNDWRSVEQ